MIYNNHRDEILTFGFVDACFRSSEFENIIKLPHYLVKLIGKWISIEYVHLLLHQQAVRDIGYSGINHCRINVDDILTSIV